MQRVITDYHRIGYNEAKNGELGYHNRYDAWDMLKQKQYEAGRLFWFEHRDRYDLSSLPNHIYDRHFLFG